MNVVTKTLANGLRLIADPMPQVETACVGVWVDVGARHEREDRHGIAHVLEHMAFKGTKTRDARRIAEEIEAVGGYLNAFTSREQTAYYARVLKADIPLALDLVHDILAHATFSDAELAREKEVIVQEIGEALDTPDDLIFDHLQEASYEGQILGRTILGTPDSVRSLTSDILRSHLAEHYLAGSMVVVASGAIVPDTFFQMAEERFGDWRPGVSAEPARAAFTIGERRVLKKLEQAHVALAFDGVAYDHPDAYTASVYATVLGGGMSSRLFQEAREKRGLCYSIYAFAGSMVDGGALGIYAGTAGKDVNALIEVAGGQMLDLAAGAEEAEIARARAQLKAGLMMGLESPSQRAEQIARQVLIFGRALEPAEMMAKVDAVDPERFKAFAERMARTKPALAALGPIKGLDRHQKIAARFG